MIINGALYYMVMHADSTFLIITHLYIPKYLFIFYHESFKMLSFDFLKCTQKSSKYLQEMMENDLLVNVHTALAENPS